MYIYIISHEIPWNLFKNPIQIPIADDSFPQQSHHFSAPPLKRWGQHFQWPHHRLLRLERARTWEFWAQKPMGFPIGSAVFTVSIGGNSGRKMLISEFHQQTCGYQEKWGSTHPIVVKYSNGNANRLNWICSINGPLPCKRTPGETRCHKLQWCIMHEHIVRRRHSENMDIFKAIPSGKLT